MIFSRLHRRVYSRPPFLPHILHEAGRCRLPRGVVAVTGQDASKFLNGLCTRDILHWSSASDPPGMFAGFLNAHGRMLYDSFLLKVQDGYLLDCDSRVVSDFIFHLKQYRLRSKLTIEDWSTRWAVVAEWNWAQEGGEHCGHPISDERCDWRMRRVFVPRERGEVVDHISDDPSIYNVLRMINGVPEGPAELVRNKAIPVEYNLDLMKGVDLHKGCYLGQELVTRTIHRGVIRKRVLPIEIYEPDQSSPRFHPDPSRFFEGLELEADMLHFEPLSADTILDVTKIETKRPFGRIVSLQGNVGVALVRLDEMPAEGKFVVHRPHPSNNLPSFVMGRARIPSWWPPNP